VQSAHGAGAFVAKPSEVTAEHDEPANVAPTPVVPNAAALPNGTDVPVPSGTGPAEPGASGANNPAPSTASPPAVGSPHATRGKGDFNTQAAREALEDAAGRAVKCRNIDTPAGTARVAVTFAPNGHVTNAVIESGPFVGTTAGSCVASKFRSAKVPPFSGDSVLVRKNVPF
jgi:hypothetical protein